MTAAHFGWGRNTPCRPDPDRLRSHAQEPNRACSPLSEALQTSRYLPPTTIRVVIDEKGQDHHNKLSHSAISRHRQQIDANTGGQVIRAKLTELKTMMKDCEQQAQARQPELLAQAHKQSEQTLMREVNRLRALQQINPNIRQEEIDFFEQQLDMLNDVLDSATLRLDAVRIIVAT